MPAHNGHWQELRRVASRQKGLLIGVALLLSAALAFPLTSTARPGPYARAKLTCTRSAAVGAAVSVDGNGFQPDAGVVVRFDSPPAEAETRTSSAGTFSTSLTVPPGATKGAHEITATVTGADNTVVTKACSVRVQA